MSNTISNNKDVFSDRPHTIQSLLLVEPTKDRKLPHFSAASGIAISQNSLFVIADDEHFLAHYDLNSPPNQKVTGKALIALPEILHEDGATRKKEKRDWEAIAKIGPYFAAPFGGLLILPSGSTKQRTKGVLLAFDQSDNISFIKPLDLTEIYGWLRETVEDFNIEGAMADANELMLFNRSVLGKDNAVITLKLEPFLTYFEKGQSKGRTDIIEDIKFYQLPKIDQVPLGFSDATQLKDGSTIFIVSAEKTLSAYADGAIAGCAIGLMNKDKNIQWLQPLNGPWKAEGIATKETDTELKIYIVTDADNPEKAAQLLTYVVPL